MCVVYQLRPHFYAMHFQFTGQRGEGGGGGRVGVGGGGVGGRGASHPVQVLGGGGGGGGGGGIAPYSPPPTLFRCPQNTIHRL